MLEVLRMWLSGRKTYLTGIAAVLTAIAGWGAGELPSDRAIDMIYTALMLVFVRAGVAKAGTESGAGK